MADVRYGPDRDAVKAALNRPDKLPFVGQLYHFWQDSDHQPARGSELDRRVRRPGASGGLVFPPIKWRSRAGRTPPILLATTRRDDRVHPGHARKMAAKLQAMGYLALFYEPPAGGQSCGKDNGEVVSFSALGSAFLRRAIGWGTA